MFSQFVKSSIPRHKLLFSWQRRQNFINTQFDHRAVDYRQQQEELTQVPGESRRESRGQKTGQAEELDGL
jgi:hypothetical protein